MSLTLEMPSESSTDSHTHVTAPLENPIADEAAAMVEGGEGDGEEADPDPRDSVTEEELIEMSIAECGPDGDRCIIPVVDGSPSEDDEEFPDWATLTPEGRAQRCYDRTLREAEQDHTEASLQRLKLEGDYKAAKKIEKECLERVQEVIDDGWKVFMRKEDAANAAAAEVVSQEIENNAGLAFDSPDDWIKAPPRDWRTVSIDELGLEGKYIDKLKDADAGTMGGLEDLRAEIAAGKSKWPRGVGPAKIEVITEKLLTWLSEHRDGMELQERTPDPSLAEAAEVQPVVGEVDEDAQLESALKQIEWQFPHDGSGPKPLAPSDKKYQGHFDDGGTAARNGEHWRICSWTAGEQQDNWLRGWLRESRAAVADAEPAAAASAPTIGDVNVEDL